MIYQYSTERTKNTDTVKTKNHRPPKEKKTPFPKYRLVDDAVIDDILYTLREEENAAHE